MFRRQSELYFAIQCTEPVRLMIAMAIYVSMTLLKSSISELEVIYQCFSIVFDGNIVNFFNDISNNAKLLQRPR